MLPRSGPECLHRCCCCSCCRRCWLQVTAEGGLEAAYEAPNVYSAIDALAARARSFAERRQRLLLEGADPLAQVNSAALPPS